MHREDPSDGEQESEDIPSSLEDPRDKAARRLAYATSLWAALPAGILMPFQSFEGLLEYGIDKGRSVRTIWARWLALAGTIFWVWVAVMPVGPVPFPVDLIVVAVFVSAVIAWYWDSVGGWLFMGEAVVLAAYLLLAASDRSGMAVFSLPALLTGFLFLTGRRSRAAFPPAGTHTTSTNG